MQDMLVNLLRLPDFYTLITSLKKDGIDICRALAPDKYHILDWVKKNDGIHPAGECDVSFSRQPLSCFIARQGASILGYACYNATAPDFFGPTKVLDSQQGKGIGKVLLLKCLEALRYEGYVYAIIGGVGPAEFYTKCCGATLIPDSSPGIYGDFLGFLQK